jgi:phosphate-selective porin OprO/OprP
VAPQLYYFSGPFGLFAEYVISDQRLRLEAAPSRPARVRNTAWQVAASYVLTGEENSWKGFAPKRAFSPGQGAWGAWEIAVRVGQLEVDAAAFPALANPATSARAATAWSVGLNWHLNRNLKLNLDYEQTEFDGGSSDFLNRGEKALLGRTQFSF